MLLRNHYHILYLLLIFAIEYLPSVKYTAMKYLFLKILYFLCFIIILWGCKPKMAITSSSIDSKIKLKEVIRAHQATFPNFKTLSGSVTTTYKNGKDEQTVTLSFRMEKDKAIWLSAPLGIAKVYITPQKASFYNKLDNTHFEGDFSYISNLLGFSVDFQNLQNLLLGQTIYPLTAQGDLQMNEHFYFLNQSQATASIRYGIIPGEFRVGFFEVTDSKTALGAKGEISYQQVENQILPSILQIESLNQEMNIRMDFKNIQLNSKVNFPYRIPSGSKAINN
ncbi:Uncharacterised protein [Capnocytophaga canimorsus]|nr:uncharacterized protein DUF4292 [Capnocytophaga canimorsus]STA72058.1 Uncharacterised protein [Capnocytophaga canimorsus]